MKRTLYALLMGVFLFFSLSFITGAEELTFPEISIPSELSEYFPLPTMQDTTEIVEWFDTQRIFDYAKTAWQGALSGTVRCFFSLVSVAALCAVIGALSQSVENKGVATAALYLAVLCGASVVLEIMQTLLSLTTEHLQTLSAFAWGVIPVYAGVCTASGMGGLAMSGGTGLALSSSFAALLSAKVLFPLLGVCFVFDFSASVSGLSGISQVSATVRRFFVGLVGGVSALLTAIFAFQTQIAAKADTLAGRTLRYVTATALPLVGSALSEASRTLSSAFSLMGGVVGGVGVAVVVLLLLPVLLQLWLLRLGFLMAGGIADILSCPRIAALYRDGGALIGALMATMALVDAVLIFEFALLLRM